MFRLLNRFFEVVQHQFSDNLLLQAPTQVLAVVPTDCLPLLIVVLRQCALALAAFLGHDLFGGLQFETSVGHVLSDRTLLGANRRHPIPDKHFLVVVRARPVVSKHVILLGRQCVIYHAWSSFFLCQFKHRLFFIFASTLVVIFVGNVSDFRVRKDAICEAITSVWAHGLPLVDLRFISRSMLLAFRFVVTFIC